MRATLVAVVFSARAALATEVYLNGVNVAGLTNQRLEKVSVFIDAQGNVHLDAPGYVVKRVAAPAEGSLPRPEEVLARRYYLVTEQTEPGATDFDVEVLLNGAFLRTLGSTEQQQVTEVTQQLRPGTNALVLQARKRTGGVVAPRGTSRSTVFRVVLGEGTARDGAVVFERQLVNFTRSAAEPSDVAQAFSFVTR